MAGAIRTRKKPARPGAQRTRERLLAAGRKVFAEKGLGGASLREDILRQAGVSTGSFYHQFRDKEDLLVEILRCDGEVVLRTMERGGMRPDGDLVKRGGELLLRLFEMSDQHPEFIKIFVREYYSDSPRVRRAIRSHSQRTIEHVKSYYEALASATGKPLDVEGIATLLTVQVLALANYHLDFPRKKREAMRKRMVAQVLQLAAGGVLAVRRPGTG